MSISESVKVCQDCGIYKGQCSSAEERKVIMPPISNINEYTKYVKDLQIRGEYDILLKDDSMFQFDKLKKEIIVNKKKVQYDYYRYCFIQSPTVRMTFDEYCEGWADDDSLNIELMKEMYENDMDIIENFFPFYMRYDVDYKGYLPNSHSYAHLHIGFSEGYRMPVSLILTPKAFVCMILKLAYSDVWKQKVVSSSDIKGRVYAALKSQCCKEKNPYWESTEEDDLYIR